MRSSTTIVTFQKPFAMAGVEGNQPAGRYEVMTDEEEIPGVSFLAWRRVSSSLRLPSLDTPSAQEQWVTIDPDDLKRAVARDQQQPAE